MYHIPRREQRRLRAAGPGCHHPGRHAFRPPAHALVPTKMASGVRLHHGAARSRPGYRRAAVAGQERGRGAQDADRHARDAGQEALHRAGTGTRAQQVADLVGAGVQRSRAGRRGLSGTSPPAIGACSSCSATAPARPRWAMCRRRPRPTWCRATASRAATCPPKAVARRTRVDLSECSRTTRATGLQERVGLRPSPANIDKLTLRKKLDCPTARAAGAVARQGHARQSRRRRCRSSSARAGPARPARHAAAVADQLNRGTAKLSRQDIQDRLTSCRPSWASARAPRCASPCPPRANLPELTTLALDIVRNANFPKDQLEEYQRQLETSIRNAMTEPSGAGLACPGPPGQSVARR